MVHTREHKNFDCSTQKKKKLLSESLSPCLFLTSVKLRIMMVLKLRPLAFEYRMLMSPKRMK